MNDERKSHMSSIIGETAVVIGNISGQGDLEIRGKVQGSIELIGRVFVAEGGIVLGSIEAGTVTVSGEVRGDLSAKDGILIQVSGEVEGNLLAPRVGVEPGARVRGMLRTGSPPSTSTEAPTATFTAAAASIPLVADSSANSTPSEARRSFAEPDNEMARSSAPTPIAPPSRSAPPSPSAPTPSAPATAATPLIPVERQPAHVDQLLPPPKPAPIDSISSTLSSSQPEKLGKARKRRRPKKPGQAENGTTMVGPTLDAIVSENLGRNGDRVPRAAAEVIERREPAPMPPQKPRQKGPPKPPTFVKGAKGHHAGKV